MDLVDRVQELTTPLLATFGIELVEVQVVGVPRRPTLRITIDSRQGVSVDDCARVSREIEDLLDARDVMPGAYVLEVSSPGLTRTIRVPEDLARSEGRLVRLTLHQPGPSGQALVGRMSAVLGGHVEILVEEGAEPMRVPMENIARARLEIDLSSELKRARGGRNP